MFPNQLSRTRALEEEPILSRHQLIEGRISPLVSSRIPPDHFLRCEWPRAKFAAAWRHQHLEIDHENQYTPCRRAIDDVGSLGLDRPPLSRWVDMVNPIVAIGWGCWTLFIRRFYLAGGFESSPTGGGFSIPSILTCGGISLDNNSGEDANSCLVKS